jgi:hypothetical protein
MNDGRAAAAEAARSLIEDDLGLVFDEAATEDTVVETEATEASVEDADVAVSDDLEVEVPEDILELLATDEPEEEETQYSEYQDIEDEFEYDDEKRELKKKLALLEKRNKFNEDRLKVAQRPKWEAEARKFFPHCEPSELEADSRRAFLRKAQDQHNLNKRFREEALKGTQAERERIIAEAKVEADALRKAAKEESAKAWGKPSVGTVGLAGTPEAEVDESEAFRRGGLAGLIRAGMKTE